MKYIHLQLILIAGSCLLAFSIGDHVRSGGIEKQTSKHRTKLPQALFKDPSALDILAVLAVERLEPIPNYDATLKEHAKNNAIQVAQDDIINRRDRELTGLENFKANLQHNISTNDLTKDFPKQVSQSSQILSTGVYKLPLPKKRKFKSQYDLPTEEHTEYYRELFAEYKDILTFREHTKPGLGQPTMTHDSARRHGAYEDARYEDCYKLLNNYFEHTSITSEFGLILYVIVRLQGQISNADEDRAGYDIEDLLSQAALIGKFIPSVRRGGKVLARSRLILIVKDDSQCNRIPELDFDEASALGGAYLKLRKALILSHSYIYVELHIRNSAEGYQQESLAYRFWRFLSEPCKYSNRYHRVLIDFVAKLDDPFSDTAGTRKIKDDEDAYLRGVCGKIDGRVVKVSFDSNYFANADEFDPAYYDIIAAGPHSQDPLYNLD